MASFYELDLIKQQMIEFIDWFNRFIQSYKRLLNEIERRNKETAKRLRFISFCNYALRIMTEKEQNIRNSFLQNEGKWIPTSLCPPILVLLFSIQF